MLEHINLTMSLGKISQPSALGRKSMTEEERLLILSSFILSYRSSETSDIIKFLVRQWCENVKLFLLK